MIDHILKKQITSSIIVRKKLKKINIEFLNNNVKQNIKGYVAGVALIASTSVIS